MKNRVGWTPGGVRVPILSGFRSGVRQGPAGAAPASRQGRLSNARNARATRTSPRPSTSPGCWRAQLEQKLDVVVPPSLQEKERGIEGDSGVSKMPHDTETALQGEMQKGWWTCRAISTRRKEAALQGGTQSVAEVQCGLEEAERSARAQRREAAGGASRP